MSADLLITLINRVNKALYKGIIGKKSPTRKRKTTLNREIVQKLRQIWHGQVYLYQRRDSTMDIVEYKIIFNPEKELGLSKQPLDESEELIALPALESMNPTSMIKDRKEAGVKLRQMVEVKYAWWGYDHVQLATMVKFTQNMPEETRAIFGSIEDVITSDILVDYVSREYFNKIIKHLLIPFSDFADDIVIELHEVIQEKLQGFGMDLGGDDDNVEDNLVDQ
jgi:hypothetical protein